MQQVLIEELQSLAAQRRETLEKLANIDGAEQMVRHLLGKLSRGQVREQQACPAGKVEANGGAHAGAD